MRASLPRPATGPGWGASARGAGMAAGSAPVSARLVELAAAAALSAVVSGSWSVRVCRSVAASRTVSTQHCVARCTLHEPTMKSLCVLLIAVIIQGEDRSRCNAGCCYSGIVCTEIAVSSELALAIMCSKHFSN